MSLKAELETWAAALKAYDEEDFERSLNLFSVRLLFYSNIYFFSPIPSPSGNRRLFKNTHKYGSHLRYSWRA
jgi:hypothetical protein